MRVETTFDEISKKHSTLDELILDDLHPRVTVIEKHQPAIKKDISSALKTLTSLE
jgi:hypothetical protein